MKTKFNGILMLLLALVVQVTFAQEKTISGTVSDESGPLPGVSVLKKGTTQGTETDFDGKYSIKAKIGDVLIFSFVGMETVEKTVGKSGMINVSMKVGNVLDEVVVTGVAGATNRKKLSITVDKIDEESIKQVTSSSAANALQGKVAGIKITTPQGTPGGSSNIQLRGATNLSGSQDPLIIVDGIMIEGDLSDINVDDIESYEILKGAAGSSYYGSRAGNGVVVITTKRGKSLKTGESQINFRSETGFSQATRIMKTSKSHAYKLASDYKKTNNYTKYEGVTYPSSYDGGYEPTISGEPSVEDDHYLDNPYGVYYNPIEQVLRTGFNTTNYISLSNRSEKTNVFTSFERHTNSGILTNIEGYERLSFRVNLDHKVFDWLTLSASNGYIKTISKAPNGISTGGTFFNLATLDPDVNLFAYNKNGEPHNLLVDDFDYRKENTLYDFYKINNKTNVNRFLGSYNLKFNIAKGLTADYKYAMETENYEFQSHKPYDYIQWDNDSEEFLDSKGALYNSKYRQVAQNSQASLKYNTDITTDLNFSGMVSFIYESIKYDETGMDGVEFNYDGPISFNNVLTEKLKGFSYNSERNATSYLGIVGFDYKDRYIADFLIRRDGSSLFGENNKHATYYRGSLAYRISKDLNIDFINELKFHAALGTAGQRPSDFRAQYSTQRLYNGNIDPTSSTLGNPNLKPSKSTEIELGITGQLDNRYNFSFTYSKTKTVDQILRVPQPIIVTPVPYKWVNGGSLTADAFEATLGVDIFKDTDFKWNFNANFSKYTNKIEKLDVAPYQTGPNSQDGDKIFYITEGESFGAMYGKTFVRNLNAMAEQLPTGKTIDDYEINSDGYVIAKGTEGTIDEQPIIKTKNGLSTFEKIGDATPDFRVGFSNNFSYKGWGLYALFDWQQGGQVYNRTNQWLTRDNRSELVDQSGKPSSSKKTYDYYQGLYDKNSVNSAWVEDVSYVKLRELALSYDIPTSFLNNKIKKIKISLLGRNLLTFTDYSGYDPEVATYGSGNGQSQYYAVDYGNYPQVKTYSLSINLNF